MDNRRRLLLSLSDDGLIKDPPVICPGGMMSMVCQEVSNNTAFDWYQAHTQPDTMAKAAMILAEATGFENYGVPFCVTVEAEAIGGIIDYGNAEIEPRITDYVLTGTSGIGKLKISNIRHQGRVPVVLEAISTLKEQKTDTPIIGNLTGPVSLATSLIDPNYFFRYMVKDKAFVRELMDLVTEAIATFGESQAEAGADVISIGDPTASGEIIGPEIFQEFVLPSLQAVIKRIKQKKARTILHICGNTTSILGLFRATGADAYSFDAVMPVKTVRSIAGDWVLMGNLSTFLLADGTVPAVVKSTKRIIEDGIDIVSPACGLGTGTPLKNIRTLTDTVKKIRTSYEQISA